MSDTCVFVPTRFKSFLRELLESRKDEQRIFDNKLFQSSTIFSFFLFLKQFIQQYIISYFLPIRGNPQFTEQRHIIIIRRGFFWDWFVSATVVMRQTSVTQRDIRLIIIEPLQQFSGISEPLSLKCIRLHMIHVNQTIFNMIYRLGKFMGKPLVTHVLTGTSHLPCTFSTLLSSNFI